MYYLHEGSGKTREPIFLKLPMAPPDLDAPLPMFFSERSVGQHFLGEGMAERSLIRWVHDVLIQPDKSFVDIGAHVGTYSWVCGRKAAYTYAFECNPEVFCYLAANIALHGLTDRISPYPFALGDHEGVVDYFVRSPDGGGNGIKVLTSKDAERKKIALPMKTLDSFHLENIGLIKIDVEGLEKEVLQGAEETLKANGYPKILFESWGDWINTRGVDAKGLRDELFAYLKSLGYRIVGVHWPDMYIAEIPND